MKSFQEEIQEGNDNVRQRREGKETYSAILKVKITLDMVSQWNLLRVGYLELLIG